jgi:hypothetical protein
MQYQSVVTPNLSAICSIKFKTCSQGYNVEFFLFLKERYEWDGKWISYTRMSVGVFRIVDLLF